MRKVRAVLDFNNPENFIRDYGNEFYLFYDVLYGDDEDVFPDDDGDAMALRAEMLNDGLIRVDRRNLFFTQGSKCKIVDPHGPSGWPLIQIGNDRRALFDFCDENPYVVLVER